MSELNTTPAKLKAMQAAATRIQACIRSFLSRKNWHWLKYETKRGKLWLQSFLIRKWICIVRENTTVTNQAMRITNIEDLVDRDTMFDYIFLRSRWDRVLKELLNKINTDYDSAYAYYSRPPGRLNLLETPLIAALKAKDSYAAEVLLAGGIDPNQVDGWRKNALHYAAEKGCRLTLFNKILDKIHNVNAGELFGRTALIIAVRNNHLDIVIALINHPKIDVNDHDVHQQTALHEAVYLAVYRNHLDIIKQLLSDSSIDTSLKDSEKRTPLMLAFDMGLDECVKILREHGAPEE